MVGRWSGSSVLITGVSRSGANNTTSSIGFFTTGTLYGTEHFSRIVARMSVIYFAVRRGIASITPCGISILTAASFRRAIANDPTGCF